MRGSSAGCGASRRLDAQSALTEKLTMRQAAEHVTEIARRQAGLQLIALLKPNPTWLFVFRPDHNDGRLRWRFW